MTETPTKIISAFYNHRGWAKGTDDDTIVEPEDVLADPSGDPTPTFKKGEEVSLEFQDVPFTAKGKVVKVHTDEFGTLAQVRINQGSLRPNDVS